MKIAVGISGGELARYAVTYESILQMQGVAPQCVIQRRSGNIAQNRNDIAEWALEGGCDAVLYCDDDHIFAPSTLFQLATHDKDIVSGLYVRRDIPFAPCMYDRQDDEKRIFHTLKLTDRKLTKVKVAGAGCLLVKRKVFEALERPWWRLSEYDQVSQSDDVGFCCRAREAGFDIWCDPGCPVGHMMNAVLWPVCKDGVWSTVLMMDSTVIAGWE